MVARMKRLLLIVEIMVFASLESTTFIQRGHSQIHKSRGYIYFSIADLVPLSCTLERKVHGN